MGGPSRIDQTPVRLNTKITEDRQTPKTDFGARMKDGISATANAVASGASVAAPLVPGGAIISAAVSGANTMGGSLSSGQRTSAAVSTRGAVNPNGIGGTVGANNNAQTQGVVGNDSFSQGQALIAMQQEANMQYIGLQQQMQNENQKFSTLSNVMRVRHDTAKNSIGNIR